MSKTEKLIKEALRNVGLATVNLSGGDVWGVDSAVAFLERSLAAAKAAQQEFKVTK